MPIKLVPPDTITHTGVLRSELGSELPVIAYADGRIVYADGYVLADSFYRRVLWDGPRTKFGQPQ